MQLKYRPHIDGLRAIAVAAVLWFHTFPASLPGGFIGVDIFFVISGFLISTILYEEFGRTGAFGPRVIGDFYSRRVRRIFPSLVVVLLFCGAVGYATLMPDEFKLLGQRAMGGAGFCLNFILAQDRSYFDAEPASNPLLHLWSLGVEEQFYLILPLVIWFVASRRLRLLPVTLFLAAASYFWNADKTFGMVSASFFLPQTRLWELLIGALAALAYPRLRDMGRGGGAGSRAGWAISNLLATLGLGLIGLGFWRINSGMHVPNAWTLLPTVGCALVVCSEDSAWVNRWFLALRPLVWIGLISYPLYLWHWPLISFGEIELDNPDQPAVKLVELLGAVGLAALTYVAVERPIRRGGRVPAKLTGLLVAMGAVFFLALFVWRREGLPARFPPLIRELANLNYDYATPFREGTYFLIHATQDERDFKKDPAEIDPKKPTIVLWGDSHAAALYTGLSESYGKRFNLVQRTAAGLAPFMDDPIPDRPNWPRVNAYVFEKIQAIHPAYVILHANWTLVPDWRPVEKTLVALKRIGIEHIILVGPVPQWRGNLPQQLCNYYRRHRLEPLPYRLKEGLIPEVREVDRQMAQLSQRLGVEYVSPYRILEDSDGVLVRLDDTAQSVMSFDYGHLTVAASRYLVARFPAL